MNDVIEKTENPIAEFNEFEAQLSEFKNRYDGVVYDLTVPEEEKQARSDRYAIGKVISSLDSKHKEIKAPLKERVDLIDGERKRIKDQLLEVQNKIKSQIENHERQIQEHEEALQAKVDEIRQLAVFQDDTSNIPFTPDSEEVKRRLSILSKIEVDDSFEHRKADGTLAHVETKKTLDAILAEREKYEAEQVELERLRKEKEEQERAEREEKIRKEAEENAQQKAAEQAEREKRKAEEEKERAIQAERERIEREQREKAEREEAERKAEEAKKAKQQHRAKIHKAAKQSFMDNGLDEKTAEQVVTLIKDGLIDHVQVNY